MRIFLCGGGDGEQTRMANQRLDQIVDHTKPLLYIPLAMEGNYESCQKWIQGELREVRVPAIEMVRSVEELFKKELEKYSAIFIGGGNTYKLLRDLKTSGCFGKIKAYIENDGIVFGGSAGAILFGYDIYSCASMDKNEVGLMDTKGFDVLNGMSLFAHYMNKSSCLSEKENEARTVEYTKALLHFSETRGPVIALPEEDTLFLNGLAIEIIGDSPYYLFENGNRQELHPKMSITWKRN